MPVTHFESGFWGPTKLLFLRSVVNNNGTFYDHRSHVVRIEKITEHLCGRVEFSGSLGLIDSPITGELRYVNGLLDGQPAAIEQCYTNTVTAWAKKGKLHRLDGPAVINSAASAPLWFVNGVFLIDFHKYATEKEFLNYLQPPTKKMANYYLPHLLELAVANGWISKDRATSIEIMHGAL